MDGRFNSNSLAPNSSAPPSSSSKRRRTVQKRVVTVPVGESEASKMKGEGAPPSDSWAWRKYGQKPIKGSPYPRGYYRCSSFKGCPARKQVERSRVDPTMLVITYACDHNHPWPTSRSTAYLNSKPSAQPNHPPQPPSFAAQARVATEQAEHHHQFPGLDTDAVLTPDGFSWFFDLSRATTTDALLEGPIVAGANSGDDPVLSPMGEEDESLFADLGELPECSAVFRRRLCDPVDENRRFGLAAPWCGSTS